MCMSFMKRYLRAAEKKTTRPSYDTIGLNVYFSRVFRGALGGPIEKTRRHQVSALLLKTTCGVVLIITPYELSGGRLSSFGIWTVILKR